MASRGQSLDLLNRTDANQIKGNFFGLESYQDAMRVVLQRYRPERRVTAADLYDPAQLTDAPPRRHTLHRRLDDYLYLIVQDAATGRWTVPRTARAEGESLRMTLDRAVSSHHGDALDCYVWSNAPQATVLLEQENTRLFLYVATYLSGRPNFATVEPALKDHAWVTRSELLQYKDTFASAHLVEALTDIAADSMFES
ncbi:Mitochondrial ribosomal protein L17 (ISS) [Strigomonas culicis]|nr:Mitochondrial ribosomal protein L17 (ISS) [Strigomonas culicis]|eukprot:EPY32794.1 Mitochondrial ribosomal protein L17 (ISS) [Strigomonas culicis]